jgi:hypothetical protein
LVFAGTAGFPPSHSRSWATRPLNLTLTSTQPGLAWANATTAAAQSAVETTTLTAAVAMMHFTVIMGESDNDSLTGGAGADALLGGTGNDPLTGGGGRDVFFYTDNGAANTDQILDYSVADGDIVDLSAVLDSHFGPADNPADFARVIQSGSNVIVQVDADGTGVNWTDVATLNGYGTSAVDLVNVLFAGTVHQFTV